MQTTSTISPPEPKVRRWTRDEYYQMGELGWFQDQRVELIDGKIVMMSSQKFSHYSAIARVEKALTKALGTGVWVRTQAPINLGPHSEPEPDVSVVAGSLDDYTDHPTTALLVAEVSDTTLAFDRREKASLYASAGIAEYWIVNLIDRQLEVHRNPARDQTPPYGFAYADKTIAKPADSVAPLAAPQQRIPIAAILA